MGREPEAKCRGREREEHGEKEKEGELGPLASPMAAGWSTDHELDELDTV